MTRLIPISYYSHLCSHPRKNFFISLRSGEGRRREAGDRKEEVEGEKSGLGVPFQMLIGLNILLHVFRASYSNNKCRCCRPKKKLFLLTCASANSHRFIHVLFSRELTAMYHCWGYFCFYCCRCMREIRRAKDFFEILIARQQQQ